MRDAGSVDRTTLRSSPGNYIFGVESPKTRDGDIVEVSFGTVHDDLHRKKISVSSFEFAEAQPYEDFVSHLLS